MRLIPPWFRKGKISIPPPKLQEGAVIQNPPGQPPDVYGGQIIPPPGAQAGASAPQPLNANPAVGPRPAGLPPMAGGPMPIQPDVAGGQIIPPPNAAAGEVVKKQGYLAPNPAFTQRVEPDMHAMPGPHGPLNVPNPAANPVTAPPSLTDPLAGNNRPARPEPTNPLGALGGDPRGDSGKI